MVAGRANSSRLLQAITAESPEERMPPNNDPLPENQVAMIRKWIERGIQKDAGSKAMATASIGFTPSVELDDKTLEGPRPGRLPDIKSSPTLRPLPILSIASSSRAPLIATSAYESIDYFDALTQKKIGSIGYPEGEPHQIRFSRTEEFCWSREVVPYKTELRFCLMSFLENDWHRWEMKNDAILAADISSNEKYVALGGTGKTIKIYSTETAAIKHTLVKHTDWITSIAYSPDGKLLATGDRTGNIHLWDAENGGVILPLSEHKGAIHSLSWRSDSQILVSASEDGSLHWWDVAKGWPTISKPNAHPPARQPNEYGKILNGVLDASFGTNGELVSCGRDGLVRRWSIDGQEIKSYRLPEAAAGQSHPTSDTKFHRRILRRTLCFHQIINGSLPAIRLA